MTTLVQCTKCGQENPGLQNPPFRAGTKLADLGVEIQQKICANCYKDWINMSVKLVNELRLDTTDPRGQEIWLKQMKTFLALDPATADPWARFLDKRVALELTDGARVVGTLLEAREDALILADFEGAALPAGFSAGAAKGSGVVSRDRVRAVDPA
jgi:Fe-S cluster biosynthesis and repair protein YggX